MKIIACVKQVPGTSEVEIDPVTGAMKRDTVAGKLNPYDLFSLETAFSLAEQTNGTVVSLILSRFRIHIDTRHHDGVDWRRARFEFQHLVP